VTIEAGIGISQWAVGGAFDSFLLPSDSRTFADIQLKSAVQQFWDPGSRVFATLGRYDYLGTFLAFFLLISAGLLYEWRHKKRSLELWWIFLLGLPALVLTYSRSSWFGFLLGFIFIAIGIKRDRRVIAATVIFLLTIGAYLAYSGIVVRQLIDVPQQSVVERFFEAFSYERWRGEYYDLGRVYWIVQTPLVVVPAAPIFGHGPGTFGGGAASALGNSDVYEELGLPFGVYGTDGYIDNNWFALWGETGTLGLLFYIGMFVVMFRYSLLLYKKSDSHFIKGIALGYCAAILAVSLNAFLASFLEARTLAFYFWMYGGFIATLGARERIEKIES
jgi:O-antigen ligase